MRQAYVTGATGFVGMNVVLSLLDHGWSVTALYRPDSHTTDLERLPVKRVPGDITDIESLRASMPPGPDAVVHVAGNVNMWSQGNAEQSRDNVDGTANMVQVALERGARKFVYTSSIAAFGLHDSRVDESTPENATRSWINYPRTKALAEREVRRGIDKGLDAVILNPASVIGAYDRHNWSTMIYLACKGRLLAVPAGSGSFCHAGEVARAHVTAIDKGRTGHNYLLGGTDASYLDLARVVGEVTGRKVPRRTVPPSVLWAASRVMTWSYPLHRRRSPLTPEAAKLTSIDMLCSNDKAQRELGHQPVPLRPMIEECYRWMLEEGRVPRFSSGARQSA